MSRAAPGRPKQATVPSGDRPLYSAGEGHTHTKVRDPRRPARHHCRPRLRRRRFVEGALRCRLLAADRRRPHQRPQCHRPRRRLAASRSPGPLDHAGLHRHACAQPAARRDRQPRRAVARLAQRLHLPGRAPPCRPAGRGRGRGAVPRRIAGAWHDGGGGVPDRAQDLGRRAVRRCAAAPDARHRRQGVDGSARARWPARRRPGADRARLRRPDCTLARQGSIGLRRDAALRADLDAAAARHGRRAARRARRHLHADACGRKPRRGALGGRAVPARAQLPRCLPPARPARRTRGAGPRHLARRSRSRAAGRHRRADRAQPEFEPLPRQRPAGLARAARRRRRSDAGVGRRRRHNALDAAHAWPRPTRCRRCRACA